MNARRRSLTTVLAGHNGGPHPFVNTDERTLREIGERLATYGFLALAAADAPGRLPGGVLDAATERPAAADACLVTLSRLFIHGEGLAAELAREALPPPELEEWVRAGLIERRAETVRACVTIRPYEGLLLLGEPHGRPPAPDYVMRVNESTETLARMTVRRRCSSALDLGTGCGVQALLAARHCDVAVGVDANERALAFAQANATLNGVTNLELVHGNWLEPVSGRRFDLIVANPPYVISPEAAFAYRDSGLPSDEISRRLVRDIPRHLEPGGYASILCNWVLRRGEHWSEPLREWVSGSGCDVLLLHYLSQNPLVYAARYHQELHREGGDVFGGAVRRWLDYYDREQIERIGIGLVVLRRDLDATSKATRVRPIEVQSAQSGPAGDELVRLLEASQTLAGDEPLVWEIG